jgi:dihydrofolate synthase/folylpolyglutamate synthase
MDYEQALSSLFGLIDYERRNDTPTFDLASFRDFLRTVGSPHRALKRPILIAGTKGKGSTAAFIASVLKAAGYTTGLFTSPHLKDVRERIRIDGTPMSEHEFAQLVGLLMPLVDREKSSFRTVFEILTAMAFMYFSRRPTDVAVLEVGMGGRLDATNVVTPILSVVTPISYDHTSILGESLEQIAREKSGIVRSGGLAISAPQREPVRSVLEERCAQMGSGLVFSDSDWTVVSKSLEGQTFSHRGQEYTIPLLGEHQVQNAILAMASVGHLNRNDLRVTTADLKRGLAEVTWDGRMQLLFRSPFVLVDGAHNGESAAALNKAVRDYFSYEKLILILGISRNKDIRSVIDPLSEIADEIIFTRAKLPKAEKPELLRRTYSGTLRASIEPGIVQALKRAFSIAGDSDLILVTGSLYLVGEAVALPGSWFRQSRQRLRPGK